jgi:hypothetical protein
LGDLAAYFETATCVDPKRRRVGVEVETLFVGGDGEPLGPVSAEGVFAALISRGWQRGEDSKVGGRELTNGDFALKPEVGAGNLEIISPARPVDELDTLLDDVLAHLEDLYAAAADIGAAPVAAPHDGHPDVDNIILDNERDRQWVDIDGREALRELAHIASVHVTVDLCSIDEGFAFIRELNDLARERDWPPELVRASWQRYLQRSRCNYAAERFGQAPESFASYLELLRGFRVVVDRGPDGQLRRREEPPRLADVESDVDLPTFLGTVWLDTRLRRMNDTLALEARFVPRTTDEALRHDVGAVLDCMLSRVSV